jgi:hypothetical protein
MGYCAEVARAANEMRNQIDATCVLTLERNGMIYRYHCIPSCMCFGIILDKRASLPSTIKV